MAERMVARANTSGSTGTKAAAQIKKADAEISTEARGQETSRNVR